MIPQPLPAAEPGLKVFERGSLRRERRAGALGGAQKLQKLTVL